MATQFEQDWIHGTGTYMDDILWPAVVEGSTADAGSTPAQNVAAWDAYCYYRYAADEPLRKLTEFIEAAEAAGINAEDIFPIVQNHDALSDLVFAVDQAMDALDPKLASTKPTSPAGLYLHTRPIKGTP